MCSVGLLTIDITDTDSSLSTVTSLSVLISTSVAADTDFSVNIGDLYNPDIGVHSSTDTLSDTAIVSHTDFTDISVQWNTDTLMLASIDFNLYRVTRRHFLNGSSRYVESFY
jgi:hypothetical protein